MNIRLARTPTCLAKDELLFVTEAKGSLVRCLSGGLWVTQGSDPRDIVLAPGQTFTLDGRGATIVSALVASCVELLPSRRTRHQVKFAQRWIAKARAAILLTR